MNLARPPLLVGLGAATSLLLPRMRREFETTGNLSPATASAMWGCYVAAGAIYGDSLRRGRPLPRTPRKLAPAVAAAGLGLTAAGMGAFDSAGQVTGNREGPLVVGGVYRISRNPQYVGYVIAGAAGALARRSPLALALTAAYVGVCRWWVPVEERALERRFGAAYRDFHAATPRWVGLPRLRGDR